MAKQWIVSSSPHVRSKDTSQNLMRDVVIALLPATIVGFIVFKGAAIFTVLLTVLAAVGFEFLYGKLTKQPNLIKDYSAVVTGLLLGLNLPASLEIAPPSVAIVVPVIGSFFAIIIVKQLFGGIGNNFMNPALAARAFLIVSFAEHMTTWPKVDTVASATILASLKEGGEVSQSVMDAFIGTVSGSIGEVSALAILIGGIYLIVRKVISYRIPFFFIATVAIFVFFYSLASGKGMDLEFVAYHLFSGGLMLGAFFMATDYVTSPMTAKGQIIFAVGCGIITSLIRLFGSYPEGVSFAIIIMNLTVPLIDRFTIPRAFGEAK
ncbi:MAG: RnfABCDGE type electron transport complex subunit D [Vallitaleaceae bacterium]|nr:RnfABCDGE type electron transport complex subunit D [Vallitaleaceae bacterium]